MNKKSAIKIIVLLAGFVIILSMIILFRPDPTFDDSDILPVRRDIAPADNAYDLLMKLEKSRYEPEYIEGDTFCELVLHHYYDVTKAKGDVPDTSIGFDLMYQEVYWGLVDEEYWDTQMYKSLVEKHQVAIDYFDSAIDRPYLQFPIFDPFSIVPITFHSAMRYIARFNRMRALRYYISGDQEAAFKEAMKIIRLGHMLANAEGNLITYLTGYGISAIGTERLREFIPKTSLAPPAMKEIIKEYERHSNMSDGQANAYRVEYLFLIQIIEGVKTGKLTLKELVDSNYFWSDTSNKYEDFLKKIHFGPVFKLNRTKKMYAELFRMLIDNTGKTYNKWSQQKPPPAAPKSILDVGRYLLSGTSAGKLIFKECIFHDSMFPESQVRWQAQRSAVEILLALKVYQLTYGNLPETLDQLVPEFLNEIRLTRTTAKRCVIPGKRSSYTLSAPI